MPQSDRDRAMVEHLAIRVMGWTLDIQEDKAFAITKDGDRIRLWSPHSLMPCWAPLDSWADAGLVWERAREMGYTLTLQSFPNDNYRNYARAGDPTNGFGESFAASGPRAICEAVVRATGWQA